MKGVVLAGGTGTRLRPLTKVTNKHLLPVYDRPMIDYPIQTLKDMGCDDIIIVSGGEHIGGFAEYLGEGYTYRVQTKAGGIAEALGCVAGLTSGLFTVVLGDNYFSEAPPTPDKPTLYTSEVPDPQRFGVYQDGHIEEKPLQPESNQAVTGLYVYDDRVFDMIPKLQLSARGELEITDINNMYLKLGAQVLGLDGYWRDMGTHDTLLEVANFVKDKR